MGQFFSDRLSGSKDIVQRKAIGTAIFKFTADEHGAISKIIVYYTDDTNLVPPIIDALKKSNRKWLIPGHEKTHDFVIPFVITFTPSASDSPDMAKAVYKNYQQRTPILATDQVPLDMTTLLPPVKISYDVPQQDTTGN